MILNYVKSQSSVKPELVDTTSSKKVVYLRKNIVEVVNTDDDTNEEYIYYEYEEAKLTKEEYKQYLEELNNNKTLESIENLQTENQMLREEVDMLTACLVEMSEIVYA